MMKKIWISLLLTMVLISVISIKVGANETSWHINWNGDKVITEYVTTGDKELISNLKKWGFSYHVDQGYYSRTIEGWEIYNDLDGKFPIMATTKDFIIFTITTLTVDTKESTILDDLEDMPVNIKLSVPGFFWKSTADKKSDLTAEWNLKYGWEQSLGKPYLTKIVVFDGFMLGVFIFLIGLIAITIVFLKAVSRANKIIDEEYSIKDYANQQNELNKKEK